MLRIRQERHSTPLAAHTWYKQEVQSVLTSTTEPFVCLRRKQVSASHQFIQRQYVWYILGVGVQLYRRNSIWWLSHLPRWAAADALRLVQTTASVCNELVSDSAIKCFPPEVLSKSRSADLCRAAVDCGDRWLQRLEHRRETRWWKHRENCDWEANLCWILLTDRFWRGFYLAP